MKRTKNNPPDLFDNRMIPDAPRNNLNPMVQACGLGPPGQTCLNCRWLVKKSFSKSYYKCGLRKDTNGTATDIRISWDACAKFEVRPRFFARHAVYIRPAYDYASGDIKSCSDPRKGASIIFHVYGKHTPGDIDRMNKAIDSLVDLLNDGILTPEDLGGRSLNMAEEKEFWDQLNLRQ
jgi:hypothetical protein